MKSGVIDVGTTNIKLAIYDDALNKVQSDKQRNQLLPSSRGFKEQDGKEILRIVKHYMNLLKQSEVRKVGFTFNRSSLVAWDKEGNPLTNVMTWMDRRGYDVANHYSVHLKLLSHFPVISSILQPQTSAVRMKWFLSNDPQLSERIAKSDAFIGTLDSFVMYNLTKKYVSDYTNIALTGLLHPATLKFIGTTYGLLKLPETIHPEPIDNIGDIGTYESVDINASIADQQAACVGEGIVGSVGGYKMTHGTGSFVDVSVPKLPRSFGRGILPLILFKSDKNVFYGIEGFLPTSGSILDWMVESGLFSSHQELDDLSQQSKRPGLVFSPWLVGSNIPYFPYDKGALLGIDTETSRADIARAMYEGISVSLWLILQKISSISDSYPSIVKCDGGLSNSSAFLKILSSVLKLPTTRSADVDATGKGVAFLLKMYNEGSKLGEAKELSKPDLKVEPDETFNESTRKRIVDVLIKHGTAEFLK
jgi:glycerol kinase